MRLGALDLANRVIMAPLTRNRAAAGQVPSPLAAEYYGQRAGAGLIVAEGTQISPLGQGYLDTPGIHTAEQVQGWRAVTDEVHRRGGKIVLQLWHVGRVSHTSVLPPGESPVAPSAIRAEGKTYTKDGFRMSPSRVRWRWTKSRPDRGLPHRRTQRHRCRLRWCGSACGQRLSARPVPA